MTEIPDRRAPGGGTDNVPVAGLLPEDYSELLDRVKSDVLSTRLRAMRTANTELIALNWCIGRLILERQRTQPWGSAVIRRLALDLRREFPDMTGLSATNLQYMRAFAAAWRRNRFPHRLWGNCPGGTCAPCSTVRFCTCVRSSGRGAAVMIKTLIAKSSSMCVQTMPSSRAI